MSDPAGRQPATARPPDPPEPPGSPEPPETRQRGTARPGRALADLIPATLDDLGIDWEPGLEPGQYVATLPGERKLKTVTALSIVGDTLVLSAFVIRNPDENHAEVYKHLLRRNLRLPGLAYAIDRSGDVYVTGRFPAHLVDADYLDHLLGVVLEAADAPFNELLVLGFLTSMKKEWAWRVSRGESLANLEAFRAVLAGSEADPAYAPGPLPGEDSPDGPDVDSRSSFAADSPVRDSPK